MCEHATVPLSNRFLHGRWTQHMNCFIFPFFIDLFENIILLFLSNCRQINKKLWEWQKNPHHIFCVWFGQSSDHKAERLLFVYVCLMYISAHDYYRCDTERNVSYLMLVVCYLSYVFGNVSPVKRRWPVYGCLHLLC